MKVLHVIHRFVDSERRGSELYAYYLCKALAKEHEVAVFYGSIKGPKTGFASNTFDGLKTFIVGCTESWDQTKIRTRSRRVESAFLEVLDGWRPDIVHFHGLLFLSLLLPSLAKRRGLRSVFTLHDFWLLCPQINLLDHEQRISWPINRSNCYVCCTSRIQRPYSWRRLWGWDPLLLLKSLNFAYFLRYGRVRQVARLMRDVDLFIAPSRQLKERFVHEGFSASKIVYCDYGTDTHLRGEDYAHKREMANPLICGFIGSVTQHKGIDVLLEAFSQLDGIFLRVYGKAAPKYLSRANRRNIHFMGEITDAEKADAFAQMDVLIVPSIWLENSPVTIHEAFLFGVPVITSNVGGMAELVTDHLNGLHFKVGDVHDLREKVRYLNENPEELQKLTANIPTMKSMEFHLEEIADLYRRVLLGQVCEQS